MIETEKSQRRSRPANTDYCPRLAQGAVPRTVLTNVTRSSRCRGVPCGVVLVVDSVLTSSTLVGAGVTPLGTMKLTR